MPDLRLAKLPDRSPVKITITVAPALNQALRQYAGIYRATYGEAESVAELIPFMLDAFLDSDKGFAKARKTITEQTASSEVANSGAGRRRSDVPKPTSTTD